MGLQNPDTPGSAAAMVAALLAQATADGQALLGPYVIATLPAAAGLYLNRAAIVTDLFGNTTGVVRCCLMGALYFWKPTSPSSGASYAVSGNLSVGTLSHPQSLVLTGSIGVGVNRTLTLDTTAGWPGCVKEIRGGLSSLVGTLTILGTGLGAGVSFLISDYRRFLLDYSSGTLTWVQLV